MRASAAEEMVRALAVHTKVPISYCLVLVIAASSLYKLNQENSLQALPGVDNLGFI